MNFAYKKLFIVTIFLSKICFAGGESSGGGGAAVCRDSNKKISSAYLLDTYEGKVRFFYNIPESNQSPKDQILSALKNVKDPLFKQLIKQTVSQIIDVSVFLPPGVGMAPTTDLGKEYGVVVPDGCGVEPIGFYESDGTLKISRSVYTALSATDKAAFFVHEAVYKIARDLAYHKDSSRSRRLVASLFSTIPDFGGDALYEAFYSPTDYSMDYFNYNRIGTLILAEPINFLTLTLDLKSSHISSVSVQCSSSYKTTRQELKNQNLVKFDINSDNCLSYNIGIEFEYGYEPTEAGEVIGTFQIRNRSTKYTLSMDEIRYGTKGTQKDISFVYFIPIYHLYKEIKDTPQP